MLCQQGLGLVFLTDRQALKASKKIKLYLGTLEERHLVGNDPRTIRCNPEQMRVIETAHSVTQAWDRKQKPIPIDQAET